MIRSRQSLLLAFALASCLGVGRASADILVWDYSLNNPNAQINGYPGPYGDVKVTLASTNTNVATITLTDAQHDGFTYLFGDHGTIALNVYGGVSSWGTFTPTYYNSGFSGWAADSVSNAAGQNVDNQGTFNFVVDTNGGATQSISSLTFSITGNTNWADASQVLFSNGSPHNNFAAAHVFVFAAPADASAGAVKTGYSGTLGSGGPPNPPSPTPEPSTLAIAGLGVLGFLGYGLRRRMAK